MNRLGEVKAQVVENSCFKMPNFGSAGRFQGGCVPPPVVIVPQFYRATDAKTRTEAPYLRQIF
jgi:hypothetical protein